MDITVIICTYNRSQLLKRYLESLVKQDIDKQIEWEILVVDNNSTDDTKKIAEAAQNSGTLNIRYVFEKDQGLSYARNKGLNEVDGGIASFVDDDCIVDAAWISNIAKAFLEYDADCVGGKILPIEWPKKIPKWFKEDLYPYVTIYDKGNDVIEWKSSFGTPFGANVSYKKSVFQKVGLFDTSLGRVGLHSFSGGEEQELNQRILKNGGKIIYQPQAVVYHPLRPEMMKKGYFRMLDFHTGEKDAILFFGEYNKRNILGIPLFIINQFIRSTLRYIKFMIRNGYNNSFRQELYCWYFLGFMWGRIKFSHGHKRNHLHI